MTCPHQSLSVSVYKRFRNRQSFSLPVLKEKCVAFQFFETFDFNGTISKEVHNIIEIAELLNIYIIILFYWFLLI